MSPRNVMLLSALFAGCSPAQAQAEEAKAPAPVVVLRVQSVDEWKENVAYFGSLSGRDELKLLTRFITFPAVDSTKPFGLYGVLGAKLADSALVGMVPVTSEKEFLETLALFKIKLTRGADGIHAVKEAPHSIRIRFAAGYAYVAHGSKEALAADRLLDPKRLVPADQSEVFSITLRPDQIPENLKKKATDWITNTSRLVQQFNLPFESEKLHALRNAFVQFATDEHLMWIKDAGELTHNVKVDRKANRLSAETRLAAKPNSRLAGRFAELGKRQSLFSALVGGNAAMSGLGHFQMPVELRKPIAEASDELMKHAEKHAKEWNRESDLAILKALVPSMKSGELDHAFSLRGPAESGFYTFVRGARVTKGGAIEKALRDRIKELPEAVRKHITLDAEKAADVKVHRIDLPEELLKHHAKVFGKNAVYFAFREDAMLVGGGDKGLAALKEALVAQPKAAPAGQFSMSVARMAAGHARDHQRVAKAAQAAFGKDKDGGKVRFVIEGGEVLRLRFDMDTSVMKFVAQLSGLR